MLKKTITYTDYDGNTRTDTFFFNLSKPEVMELNYAPVGGMEAHINKILRDNDRGRLLAIFKDLILKSYGEKSPDGLRFEKSEEATRKFSQTRAYEELYMELIMDDKAASDFINGIVPADIAEAAKQAKLKAAE